MSSALYSILTVILIICPEPETATQLTGSPSKPSFAVEGQNFRLLWNYTLDSTIASLIIDNVTGRSPDQIGIATAPGSLIIGQKYQPRFGGQVTETQADLTIATVQRSDEGRYQLTMVSTGGGRFSDPVELIVHSPASFTSVSSSQQEQLKGLNLTLSCEASGIPKPNITWVEVLKEGTESTVLHSEPTWNLINIGGDENGTYRCIAFNGVGNPAKHTITVNVLDPPKIVQFPTEYRSPAEQSVSLQCKADGYPPPSYSWTPCEENDNVCDQSVLTISEVKNDQVYTCTATNRLGSDSANTTLVIADNVINVTLVIKNEDCPYTGNQTSLEKELDIEMRKHFNASIYRNTAVNALSCGSLIVDLALSFSSVVKENYVLNVLKDAAKDGMLGRFEVDASSIKGTRRLGRSTTPPTGGTTPPTSDNMIWIIVGAVLGSLALVAIVVVIIWCVRKKNACRKETKEVSDDNPASLGRGGPSTGQQGRNSGYQDSVDTYANTSMLPPTRKPAKNSMGEKQEPQALPMYAQVDKSKRKPRPEGPAKRQPGELQYAAVDHTNNSESMPRGTANEPKKPPAYGETVYADLV